MLSKSRVNAAINTVLARLSKPLVKIEPMERKDWASMIESCLPRGRKVPDSEDDYNSYINAAVFALLAAMETSRTCYPPTEPYEEPWEFQRINEGAINVKVDAREAMLQIEGLRAVAEKFPNVLPNMRHVEFCNALRTHLTGYENGQYDFSLEWLAALALHRIFANLEDRAQWAGNQFVEAGWRFDSSTYVSNTVVGKSFTIAEAPKNHVVIEGIGGATTVTINDTKISKVLGLTLDHPQDAPPSLTLTITVDSYRHTAKR